MGRRRKFGLAVVALLIAAGAVWYFAIREPAPGDDLRRLRGDWKLAPGGREGRVPVIVRVTGDRWAYVVGGQEGKAYRQALRPHAEPREIDLTQLGPDGQPTPFVLRGIYRFQEGGVLVLVAPGGQPRPAAFDAPDGPPVWVLERP